MANAAHTVEVFMRVKNHALVGDEVITKSFALIEWEYDNMDRAQLLAVQEAAAPLVARLVELGKEIEEGKKDKKAGAV